MMSHVALLISCLPLPTDNKTDQAKRPAMASIIGKTIFEGDPRKYDPAPIMVGKDLICAAMPKPVFTEEVLLSKASPVTVRNVVVSIKGPVGGEFPIPEAPAILECLGCRYTPHVLAVQAGQTVTVRNGDRNNHVVHFLPKRNQEINSTMPTQAMQRDVTLQAEEPFRVKCDAHPWENAWIAVFDHPFFAVTGDDGAFKIDNIPPGKYTLEAWHEKFGTLQAQVQVASGEMKTIDFTFAPKPDKP